MTRKRILWALDVFNKNKSLQEKSGKMVAYLSRSLGAKVTPVFIQNPNPFMVPETLMGDRSADSQEEIKKVMTRWIAPYAIADLSPPEVICSPDLSVRSAVDVFLDFAREQSADLIVLSTHARKGVARFFLGSFAETMLLKSAIPLILVQPKMALPSQIKTILFPTDFSEKSWAALMEVIQFAKPLKAPIHLLHHLEYCTSYTIETTTVPLYQKFLAREKKQRAAEGKKWAAALSAKGVVVKVTITEDAFFILDAILAFSKKTPGCLLAMASQSEPGLSQILGSVVRRVVRAAECPVWVIHPSARPEIKKMAVSEKLIEKGFGL